MLSDPRFWSTIGLCLDILGALMLVKWPPRGFLGFTLEDGSEGHFSTGQARDDRISKFALGIIALGFMIQVIAVWIPKP